MKIIGESKNTPKFSPARALIDSVVESEMKKEKLGIKTKKPKNLNPISKGPGKITKQ